MLEAIEADPARWAHGPAWAERLRGWAAALRAADRALGQPGRARRAPARHRPRPLRARRQRLRPGDVHAAPRRPPRATGGARWSTSRAAGRRARRPGRVRYDGGRPGRLRRRPRRDAGAALRRPLHRGQAAAAADRGLRGGPRRASTAARRSCSSAASRASGRASTRCETIRAHRRRSDVFLAGWHDHAELPDFLAASDVVVLPSVREQFGQVLVEGDGLRAARRSRSTPTGRPRSSSDGETGWLVPPDDREALAAALVEAVNDPQERRRRGELRAEDARARYAWPALASASRRSTTPRADQSASRLNARRRCATSPSSRIRSAAASDLALDARVSMSSRRCSIARASRAGPAG